jgi:hypothetical protein
MLVQRGIFLCVCLVVLFFVGKLVGVGVLIRQSRLDHSDGNSVSGCETTARGRTTFTGCKRCHPFAAFTRKISDAGQRIGGLNQQWRIELRTAGQVPDFCAQIVEDVRNVLVTSKQ